jgi:hypothetical protein
MLGIYIFREKSRCHQQQQWQFELANNKVIAHRRLDPSVDQVGAERGRGGAEDR